MKMLSLRSVALALILSAAALPGTLAAQAATVIDHLPYTINVRGLYVLTNSLSSTQTSGNLITVAASNVTIDLQGNYISGPVGNTSQTTNGIYGSEVNNVTVKNGTVANLSVGIYFDSKGGATNNNLNHEVDHLRVSRCNLAGIRFIYASSASVTDCKLSYIGFADYYIAAAIDIHGPGVTVQNCVISQGIGNSSYGISSDSGSFSRQNTISNYTYGVRDGTYQDNLTYGCTQPFGAGIDAGGNY